MASCAVLAEQVTFYNPEAVDFGAMLTGPSAEHPFGTDSFGRDIFTRIVYGARTALTIGFLSSMIGCHIGAAIGIASAYHGGWVDLVLQRFIDIILSFPIVVLALVVVAVMGKTMVLGIDLNLVFAIAIPIIPRSCRVIRAATLSIRTQPYVDAARAGGYSTVYILLRYIAPNVIAPFLVLLTAYIAQAILLEASLSFLGLGVTEPKPAWGLMLAGDSANFYNEAPWMILFPGLAISLSVFAWGLPAVKAALEAKPESALADVVPIAIVAPEFPVPRLHEAVAKVAPATHLDRELERAVFRLNWLSAAGTGILLAALVAIPWLGIAPRRAWRIWGENLSRLALPLVTIAAMLALAFVTRYSGTDVILGLAMTRTGPAYPLFAALLGWLGVALTGSDTSSNALFGSLQRVTAGQLGLDPLLICTANSTGGVMGKMIDAQSIVVAATATGIDRQEGAILRRVFPHSLALAVLVGLLVWLQTGPLAWMVPAH
jgi:peptide/nickel transport system permease protein